jgi:methionine-rich copper-binding protein CopC
MKDLYDAGNEEEWNLVILDLDGTSHFWLTAVCGSDEPRFSSGSRILLATMTMKLQDTMNICIDTCFWPPHNTLAFNIQAEGGGVAVSKKPRSGTGTSSFQVCFPHASEDVREIEGSSESKPSDFSLSQNYPNPFNPITNFQFSLSKSSHVKIEIFNIVGQKVKVLVDEDMKPGVYSADWNSTSDNGNTVSSGIYFYRMQAGDFADTKKMVLMK